jgi:PhoP regulatory network protein YrbL
MTSQTETGIIRLSGHSHIAEGRRQFVFEHPNDAGSLIKVNKPEQPYEPKGPIKRFFSRFRYNGEYQDFLREFREYLELRERCSTSGEELPLCEVRGIVQTDLGIGLVYERISNPDGQLAPTLKALIDTGRIGEQQIEELEAHFRSLKENRVSLSNFNLRNIVYQSAPDGHGRFVWIDSFGSKQFVPWRKWFKSLNDRKLRKIQASCYAAIATVTSGPKAVQLQEMASHLPSV